MPKAAKKILVGCTTIQGTVVWCPSPPGVGGTVIWWQFPRGWGGNCHSLGGGGGDGHGGRGVILNLVPGVPEEKGMRQGEVATFSNISIQMSLWSYGFLRRVCVCVCVCLCVRYRAPLTSEESPPQSPLREGLL